MTDAETIRRLKAENESLYKELERLGNPHAKYEQLNGVIRRQRRQLSEVQYALKCRNSDIAKLRDIVRRWYPHMVKRVDIAALSQWGDLQTLYELGIEVGE